MPPTAFSAVNWILITPLLAVTVKKLEASPKFTVIIGSMSPSSITVTIHF